MTTRQVVVHAGPQLLAAAAAARLITKLVDVQNERGVATVALTGGSIGIEVLQQLRVSPARDAVDWANVELYWGDERFLPAADGQRNETQAREALLDHVPVRAERVHPMAPAGGRFGADAEAAAAAYATGLPADLDLCLLGVGEEGHVASVFPDSPAVHETARDVVAVRDCPKPPPTRISLTLPAIRRATEVWLLTAGTGKAAAVASALGGATEVDLPAAGAVGKDRTLWLVDKAAAANL